MLLSSVHSDMEFARIANRQFRKTSKRIAISVADTEGMRVGMQRLGAMRRKIVVILGDPPVAKNGMSTRGAS